MLPGVHEARRSAPAARREKTTRQGGSPGWMHAYQEGRHMKFVVMGMGEYGGNYGSVLV